MHAVHAIYQGYEQRVRSLHVRKTEPRVVMRRNKFMRRPGGNATFPAG